MQGVLKWEQGGGLSPLAPPHVSHCQTPPSRSAPETRFAKSSYLEYQLGTRSDVNKANSVKAKARQYKAKARGLHGQGQGLTLQRIKSRS